MSSQFIEYDTICHSSTPLDLTRACILFSRQLFSLVGWLFVQLDNIPTSQTLCDNFESIKNPSALLESTSNHAEFFKVSSIAQKCFIFQLISQWQFSIAIYRFDSDAFMGTCLWVWMQLFLLRTKVKVGGIYAPQEAFYCVIKLHSRSKYAHMPFCASINQCPYQHTGWLNICERFG